jgi:hypothetical protein
MKSFHAVERSLPALLRGEAAAGASRGTPQKLYKLPMTEDSDSEP